MTMARRTALRAAPPRCWIGMLLVVLCVSAPALSVPADMASTTAATPTMTAAPKSPQDIPSFFPKIKNDLTKVTWAHAVNSKDLLAQALNGSVMMLEADVLMGTTTDDPNTLVPIMGHPPANRSDLSLRDFLHAVVTHNTDNKDDMRGVKLDFKTIEVFEKALDYMKETFDQPQFPVWLNADILPGPVNSTNVPVDADRFLVKAKEQFPELTLSLGWTTRWGKGLDGQDVPAAEATYSDKAVRDMISTITSNKVTQPITYAVRAAFVAHSLDTLKTLLKETAKTSAKPTLTVWSSDDTDVIDVKMLRKNILELGKTNVYVDVGEKLSKDLNLASSAISTYSSVLTTAVALVVALLRV